MKCYKCGAPSHHLLEDANGDITPVCFNCYYDPKHDETPSVGPFNQAIATDACSECNAVGVELRYGVCEKCQPF